MTWNYRVVSKDGQYGVHEVYYDEQGEPTSVSESSVVPVADSVAELRECLETLLAAFKEADLNFDVFRARETKKHP